MDQVHLHAKRPRPFSRQKLSSGGGIGLLLPNEITVERYFSGTAHEQYQQTYKQLLHHADLLRGGHKELSRIVKSGKGIFRENDDKLVELGVLYRKGVGGSEGDESTFLTRLPGSIDGECTEEVDRETSQDEKQIEVIAKAKKKYYDPDDEVEELTYNPESPRAIFLAGCVQQHMPPRSIAMLRKRISPILNLAHMSIGNSVALLLSEALEKMPFLQVLNLADNNLDDTGLSAIILSAAKHKTLEELDISQNVIDIKAANALAAYIGHEGCFLKSLRMSNSGIDDKECARFVHVLMNNRMLQELDISKNIIGKDENLNVVKPDFVTGGESLAELLRDSHCPLRSLNLHWNMLRLEGAVVLCDALRSNHFLTNLNLSYNALGSHAASVLGAALLDNQCLQRLNLASNCIDCVGAMALSVGLRENSSLREVILDGNPLGEQGTRSLMKALVHEGHRLSIRTLECDITKKTSAAKLLLNDPIGDYLLNMNRPYDRALAFELLDVTANDANYEIDLCELYLQGNGTGSDTSAIGSSSTASVGNKEGGRLESLHFGVDDLGTLAASYAVFRFDEIKSLDQLSLEEHKEEIFLQALVPLSSLSVSSILALSQPFETQGTDTIPPTCIPELLRTLYLQPEIPVANSCVKRWLLEANEKKKTQLRTGIALPDTTPQEPFLLFNDDHAMTTTLSRPSTGHVYKDKEPEDRNAESTLDVASFLETLSKETSNTLDPRYAGAINAGQFCEYILERARLSKIRWHQLRHLRRCAVRKSAGGSMDNGTSSAIATASRKDEQSYSSRPQTASSSSATTAVRFIPPTHGWLRIRLIESFHNNDPSSNNKSGSNLGEDEADRNIDHMERPSGFTLSASKCQRLIEEFKKMAKGQPMLLLQYALESAWLRLEEAQTIFCYARSKADDPSTVLSTLLLRMPSGYEARRLVHFAVGDDIFKLRRLKQRLGPCFLPLINIFTGYYSLDLSNLLDRLCLKRLIEKSVRDTECRRQQGLWDTSQHGHWSCFRNENLRAVANNTKSIPENVEGLASVYVTPRLCRPLPTKGILEFDFVGLAHPDVHNCRPMSESSFVNCLVLSRLLDVDDVDWAVKRLHRFDDYDRRSIVSNGRPAFVWDIARAHNIAEHLNCMYGALAQRHVSLKKATAREALSSASVEALEAKAKIAAAAAATASASKKKVNGESSANNSNIMLKALSTAPAPVDNDNGSPQCLTTLHDVILRLRSIANQSPGDARLTEQKVNQWGRRLQEIVVDGRGSDEHKASALLEYFEAELGSYWLECRYLALVAELWAPIGMVSRSHIGSYRVELIVLLFDRIIDLHNFEVILSVLNAEEHAAIFARIGVLNLFNPNKCEGGWSLDLERWEERQAVKMLVHMSLAEPGPNWNIKNLVLYRGSSPIPSWDLNKSWFSEEGLPHRGQISFEMYAGDGLRLAGCTVDPRLRQILCALVFVAPRDFVSEVLVAERKVAARQVIIEQQKEQQNQQRQQQLEQVLATTRSSQQFKGALLQDDDTVNVGMHHKSNSISKRVVNNASSAISSDIGSTASVNVTSESQLTTATPTTNVVPNNRWDRLVKDLGHQRAFAMQAPLLQRGLALQHQQHSVVGESGDATRCANTASTATASSSVLFGEDVVHEMRTFVAADANEHLLARTDVEWNYTSTARKPDVWT